MRPSIRSLPRALIVLYVATVVTRVGTFVVPYLTIYLAGERGLSMAATGNVVAAGGIGMVAGNLLGGVLADNRGRKLALLTAIAVNVLGISLLSLSLPSAVAYGAALALACAGAGMYGPAANALIADLTPAPLRPLAFTVQYLCVNVGMALGPLLGGLMAASSFRWLFLGDVAASLGCAALLLVCLPAARPTDAASGSSVGVWRVWRAHPAIVLFGGASFFIIAPLMGLEYAVPLLVARVFEAPLVLVGVVYSINAVTILSVSLPVERLLRGRNPLAMMAVSGGLWTAGLLVLALGASASALLASTVVWTLGEIVASVVVPTFIAEHVAPAAKARMLAIQDVVRSLAAIAAPIALGLVWDARGVAVVLGVLVATPALGGAFYLGAWVARRTRPGQRGR